MQRAFRVGEMKIIGDPHLGRPFVNNVPLHRRGHREQMLRDDFVRELNADGAAIHVCVGDLFDKPTVSLNDIWFAANAYITAAHFNSSCDYFILAGNHDLSKDQSNVSAFHIFRHLLRNVENIHVITTPQFIAPTTIAVPWSPLFNAPEMLAEWTDQAEIAFGHWDLDGNSPNLIPIEELKRLGVKRVYNGHVHLPRIETREGIEIINVGSLQPFSHGEGEEMYVTVTLDELKAGSFKDKCVRVRLAPDEMLDFDVDCLQLQIERAENEIDLTVDYDEAFDMKALIARAGETVPADIWAKVMERL